MTSKAELRRAVIYRDGGCVAQLLDTKVDPCATVWGDTDRWLVALALQLDRVRDHPAMGKSPAYDLYHCVALCPHHHLDGWATSHRPELRAYLRGHYPDPVTTEDELMEGYGGS